MEKLGKKIIDSVLPVWDVLQGEVCSGSTNRLTGAERRWACNLLAKARAFVGTRYKGPVRRISNTIHSR